MFFQNYAILLAESSATDGVLCVYDSKGVTTPGVWDTDVSPCWRCNNIYCTGCKVKKIALSGYYIVGPLPDLNPTTPPSDVMRLITSSNKIGAKSVCSTHTQ